MKTRWRLFLLFVASIFINAIAGLPQQLPQQLQQHQPQQQAFNPIDAQIIVQPKRIEKPLGASVVIPCRTRPENLPIKWLSWFDARGSPITSDHGRIRVERQDADDGAGGYNLLLQLYDVQSQDEGTFECRAELPSGRVISATAELALYREITFEDFQPNQPLRYGQSGKVRCRVSASPPALVSWYVRYGGDVGDQRRHKIQAGGGGGGGGGGNALRGSERFQQVDDGLLITNVTEQDEGVYTCAATVLERTSLKERDITVLVEREPYIDMDRYVKQVDVMESQTIGIDCPINGRPLPERLWQRAHDRYDVRQIYGGRFSVDPLTGRMTIIEAVVGDEGTYVCTGTSRAGIVESTVQVNVVEKPKIYGTSNATIAQTRSGQIWCSVRGEEPLDMYVVKLGTGEVSPKLWRASDQEWPVGMRLQQSMEIQYENDRPFRVQNLTITFTSADRRRDAGLYECNAVNAAGRVARALYVEVQHEPHFEGGPESIDKYVAISRPVNLTCIAWSIPNATVEWHKRDRRETVRGGVPPYQYQTAYDSDAVPEWVTSQTSIRNDPRFRVYVNERQPSISTISFTPMTATDIDDQDLICLAKNFLGTRLKVYRLRQAERPQGVTDVQVMEQTATAITFRLAPPKWNGGFPVTSYKIIRRRSSDAQDALRTTQCAAPPVIDDDTLARLGGNAADYDDVDPKRVALEAAVRRDTTSVTCAVTDLQPDTQYMFTVVAVNFVGTSDMGRSYSQELRTARPGKPQAPVLRNGTAVSSGAYMARWTEPLDNGARITEYLIRVWGPDVRGDVAQSLADDSGQHQAAAREYRTDPGAGGRVTEWKLTGLRPASTYVYTVQARNEFGLGASARGSFVTLLGPALPSDAAEEAMWNSGVHHRQQQKGLAARWLYWLTGSDSSSVSYYYNGFGGRTFDLVTLILILLLVAIILFVVCGIDLVCYKAKRCSIFAPLWRVCCCCWRSRSNNNGGRSGGNNRNSSSSRKRLASTDSTTGLTKAAALVSAASKDSNGLLRSHSTGRDTAATYVVGGGSASSEHSDTTPPPTPGKFVENSNKIQQAALAAAAVNKQRTMSLLPATAAAGIHSEDDEDDLVDGYGERTGRRLAATSTMPVVGKTIITTTTTISPVATAVGSGSSGHSSAGSVDSSGNHQQLQPTTTVTVAGVGVITRDSGCDNSDDDASNPSRDHIVIISSKQQQSQSTSSNNITVVAAAKTGALRQQQQQQQQQPARLSLDSTHSSSYGSSASASGTQPGHHQYVNVLQQKTTASDQSSSSSPRPALATNSIVVTSQQRLKMLYNNTNNNNNNSTASPLLSGGASMRLPPQQQNSNINNNLYYAHALNSNNSVVHPQQRYMSGRFSALPAAATAPTANNQLFMLRQQQQQQQHATAQPAYAAPSPAETSFDLNYHNNNNNVDAHSNASNTTTNSGEELPSLSTTPQPQRAAFIRGGSQQPYVYSKNSYAAQFNGVSVDSNNRPIGITRTCSVSAGRYEGGGGNINVNNNNNNNNVVVHSSDRSLVQFETDV